MKKINSSIINIFMLLICMFSIQPILAVDVPLKKGEPGTGTFMMARSVSVTQVSATLNETELFINFNNSVGIAQVTVEDQNGSVVYQDVVNTNLTLESVIETSGWESGNYTVRISYGSQKFAVTFQL